MNVTADYTPAIYDVRMVQGDTIRETFVFRDDAGNLLNVTEYQFASQVRRAPGGAAVATFDIDTEDASDGKIVRSLGTAVTDDLLGRYGHDLEWVAPDGEVRTILGGFFDVVAEVTRV